MGADLREGEDPLVIPPVALLRSDVAWIHADEDDGSLRAGVHVALEFLDLLEILRNARDESADREVLGLNGHEVGVGDDAQPFVPKGDRQEVGRARATGRCRP